MRQPQLGGAAAWRFCRAPLTFACSLNQSESRIVSVLDGCGRLPVCRTRRLRIRRDPEASGSVSGGCWMIIRRYARSRASPCRRLRCGRDATAPSRLDTLGVGDVFGRRPRNGWRIRRRGSRNLYPADATLNLPVDRHSHGIASCARWSRAWQLRRRGDAIDRQTRTAAPQTTRRRVRLPGCDVTSRPSTRTDVRQIQARDVCWCSRPTARAP